MAKKLINASQILTTIVRFCFFLSYLITTVYINAQKHYGQQLFNSHNFSFLDSMQPPENHVAMMQIDCEVMNTRLLHIHQDSIPAHVSHAMRADYSK
jgi:uncharacterized membrane protein YesL